MLDIVSQHCPPPPGDADPASTHGRECVICAPQKELPCAKVVGPLRGLPLPAATRRTEAHRHAREATQTQGIIEPAHPQGRSSQERTLRRAGKKTYDEANRSGTSVERGAQPETRDGHRANGESTRKPKTDIGRTGSPPGNRRLRKSASQHAEQRKSASPLENRGMGDPKGRGRGNARRVQ